MRLGHGRLEAGAGMKEVRNDSRAVHQQPGGDRQGNKKKPQCVAAHRASSPADSRHIGSLGEPEIALISLLFS